MNFNTIQFLFFFLPIVFVLFHVVSPKRRLLVLGISSLVFYGASGLVPLIFMVLSIAWGFVSGFALTRIMERRDWMIWTAVSFPLLILYLFKYLGFTLDSVGVGTEVKSLFPFDILSITLPAGISFYTFQIIAYMIDIYDTKIPLEKNPIRYLTFISFFAQLIAGPILRYEQIRDQLTRLETDRNLIFDFKNACKFIATGMFFKIFATDFLYAFQENPELVYNTQADNSSLDAVIRTFCYSYQLYFDFWAYSLIAIGIGKLFGLNLPRNFLEPYLARNPRDFWRRWHVTLSYWLRDYAYIKLGGNKAYARNMIIIFVLCGLWHGAGWNFVAWGVYHAILCLAYHYTREYWDRLPGFLQISATFVLVSLGWPLFFLSLSDYISLMGTLFSLDFRYTGQHGPVFLIYLLLATLWTFGTREDYWLFNTRPLRLLDNPMTQAGLISAAVIFMAFGRTFIYFRF